VAPVTTAALATVTPSPTTVTVAAAPAPTTVVTVSPIGGRGPTTRVPRLPVPAAPLANNNDGLTNAGSLPLQTETTDQNLLFPKFPPFR